jgi:hypothetical protein
MPDAPSNDGDQFGRSNLRVASIAVIVTGIVGALSAASSVTSSVISTRAAHRDVDQTLSSEATRSERANIRAALQRGAVGLISSVNSAYALTNYTGRTRITNDARWRRVSAYGRKISTAQLAVERGYAAIVVLLGRNAEVTRAYDKAMASVQFVSLDAARAADLRDGSQLPTMDDAVRIDKARIAYERAANALAGALPGSVKGVTGDKP